MKMIRGRQRPCAKWNWQSWFSNGIHVIILPTGWEMCQKFYYEKMKKCWNIHCLFLSLSHSRIQKRKDFYRKLSWRACDHFIFVISSLCETANTSQSYWATSWKCWTRSGLHASLIMVAAYIQRTESQNVSAMRLIGIEIVQLSNRCFRPRYSAFDEMMQMWQSLTMIRRIWKCGKTKLEIGAVRILVAIFTLMKTSSYERTSAAQFVHSTFVECQHSDQCHFSYRKHYDNEVMKFVPWDWNTQQFNTLKAFSMTKKNDISSNLIVNRFVAKSFYGQMLWGYLYSCYFIFLSSTQ